MRIVRSKRFTRLVIAGAVGAALAMSGCSDATDQSDRHRGTNVTTVNNTADDDQLQSPGNPTLDREITLPNGQKLAPGPICMYFVDRENGESPQDAMEAACGDSGIDPSRWIEETLSGTRDYQPPQTVVNVNQPSDYHYSDYADFLVYLWLFHTWNSSYYESYGYYHYYVPYSYRQYYVPRYVAGYHQRFQRYETTYNTKVTYTTKSGKKVAGDKLAAENASGKVDPKKFAPPVRTNNGGDRAANPCKKSGALNLGEYQIVEASFQMDSSQAYLRQTGSYAQVDQSILDQVDLVYLAGPVLARSGSGSSSSSSSSSGSKSSSSSSTSRSSSSGSSTSKSSSSTSTTPKTTTNKPTTGTGTGTATGPNGTGGAGATTQNSTNTGPGGDKNKGTKPNGC